ncbi:hypothetical protein [Pseudoxanthomonas putridarboris]|uniref:Uncharacterized protein n=1 Tax=Pseudoxanthomonas putridarboris TaxID=752605 RepID=A0ABU9J4R1_9GAMM
MLPLQETPAFTLPGSDLPCAAIDIHAELRFWETCHTQWPFHRSGTPFRYYVPTLKFAYDTYLMAHRETLADLMPALAGRYERSLPRRARLEWPIAQDVVMRVWRRMRAPLGSDAPLSGLPREAMEERATVVALTNRL